MLHQEKDRRESFHRESVRIAAFISELYLKHVKYLFQSIQKRPVVDV